MGNDGKGADLLFGELAHCVIGSNVVSLNKDSVTNAEGRWSLAGMVGIVGHGVLRIFHLVVKEFVYFIKIDCKMACLEVGYFGIWVYGNQQIVAAGGEEWQNAGGCMRCIIVSKLSKGK